MAHLLHIDSSPRPAAASVSRLMTSIYAGHWRQANPGGQYTYRDLAAETPRFVDAEHAEVVHHVISPERASDSQRASIAAATEVIDEVVAADTVLIGAPMHNLTVSTALKTWIDRLLMARTFGRHLGPRRVVILTARGGGYGPGTPMEPFNFQEPYLRGILGFVGLDGDLTFINTELTMAETDPELAQYAPFAIASRQKAMEDIAAHAATPVA